MRRTKNNSKNGQLEVSLAFHSKYREKITLLNNFMYKSTPIHQVSYTLLNDFMYKSTPIHQFSYTAVDPSENFIMIKCNICVPVVHVTKKLQPSNLVD